MARPKGTPTHWWETRKTVVVYVYNPTDEKVQKIRDFVKDINYQSQKEHFMENDKCTY